VKPSGRQIVVALAGAAVVAGLVYLTRPAPPAGEAAGSHQLLKLSDRVGARLGQLHAESSNWSGGPGAPQARSQVTATPRARHAGGESEAGTSLETTDSGAPPNDSPLADVDTDDIPTMKNIALADKDSDHRVMAVTVLGQSENPEAIPVLTQALSDTNEEVRMAALRALSDFTDEPPVEAIGSALNDPSADIRFQALTILTLIGGERARKAVEKALNDPDEDVRDLAQGIMDLETTYEDETPPGQTQPSSGSGTE
jgi:hypothetical protein